LAYPATATTRADTPSLHDALPISTAQQPVAKVEAQRHGQAVAGLVGVGQCRTLLIVEDFMQVGYGYGQVGRLRTHDGIFDAEARSEEHTSELQSRENLVCRLLLEK